MRQIDSIPVPDLASTLLSSHSHLDADSADEANDANVSFLRTPVDPQDEWRAQNAEAWEELQHRQRERQRQRDRDRPSSGNAAGAMAGLGLAERERPGLTGSAEDRARRERLQRVLNRLNRMHESSSSTGGVSASGNNTNSYGERIPRENSLYDWSPANEATERREGHEERQPEVSDDMQNFVDVERAALAIYNQLRRDQPNMSVDVLRNFARAQARAQIHQSSSDRFAARRESSLLSRTQNASSGNGSGSGLSSEPSLRSQAVLQSVRRHPRFSARSREYMQRYIMDRERYSHDSDERERWHEQRTRAAGSATNWPSPPGATDAERYEFSRLAWQSHPRSSLEQPSSDRAQRAYRRSYLENPSRERVVDPTPEPSLWLQQTITYLAKLRDCVDYEDALSHAVDASFLTKEFFGDGQDDFLWDLDAIPRPSETSWLSPGAVFAGSQHATSGYAWPLRPRETETRETGGSSYVPRSSWRSIANAGSESLSLSDSRRRMLARLEGEGTNLNSTANQPRQGGPPDRWPVKVTIHSVDYDKMTIAATMEAYNVPSYNASYSNIISAANANANSQSLNRARRNEQDSVMTDSHTPHLPILPRTSSITTYLEGEILDLTTHTFLTESYPSQRTTDATYWRKLEPFAHLSTDDDMVRTLVSQRRMRELGEKYILMRWKERCFIPKSSTSPSQPPAGASATRDASGVWDGARPWMNNGDGVMAETGEGCGLTISGFYYVCLRRSDGAVEGLYCDPESSPYQHLRLNRVGGGNFPTWSFR